MEHGVGAIDHPTDEIIVEDAADDALERRVAAEVCHVGETARREVVENGDRVTFEQEKLRQM
jgi:hypothetical protein